MMIGSKMKRDFDKRLKNKKDKKIRYDFDGNYDYDDQSSKKHASKKKKFRPLSRHEFEEWL